MGQRICAFVETDYGGDGDRGAFEAGEGVGDEVGADADGLWC